MPALRFNWLSGNKNWAGAPRPFGYPEVFGAKSRIPELCVNALRWLKETRPVCWRMVDLVFGFFHAAGVRQLSWMAAVGYVYH